MDRTIGAKVGLWLGAASLLLIAAGCGGGDDSGGTVTPMATTSGGASAPSIRWRLAVIDPTTGGQPRMSDLGPAGGRVNLSGVDWQCEVSETQQVSAQNGAPMQARAVRCLHGTSYSAFVVSCNLDMSFAHQSVDAVSLIDGPRQAFATIGLGCIYEGGAAPHPPQDIGWMLSIRTDGGAVPLQLQPGEAAIPMPQGTGWTCSQEGNTSPTDNGDQSVAVTCASDQHDVAVRGIAGCFRSGTNRRFQLLDLGVGQRGTVNAEIRLGCSSLP